MSQAFISYSRAERQFVRDLHAALARANRDAWVDWEGIPLTAEWMKEIHAGIEAADNFIFVISPGSVASAACHEELAYAAANNKRLIPILRLPVPDTKLPECLAKLNLIFFEPDDDFDTTFKRLIETLDTDLEWKREHTRLLLRASEWEQRERDNSLCLRGNDLRDAEEWLVRGVKNDPKPTSLQIAYIRSSRRATTTREGNILAAVVFALVVALTLGFIAWNQKSKADAHRREAKVMTDLAQAAVRKDEGHVTATSIAMAREAVQVREHDQPAALNLAIRAWQTAHTTEAHNAVAESFPQLLITLERHTSSFGDAVFFPDGRRILSVDANHTVRVRNSDASHPVSTLQGQAKTVLGAVFSPDGERVLIPGDDQGARVWSATTGQLLATLPRQADSSNAAFSHLTAVFSLKSDLIFTAGAGGAAEVWTANGHLTATLQDYRGDCAVWSCSVVFSHDGHRIIITGQDKTARVWNVLNGQLLVTLKGHTGPLDSGIFSPDDKQILTASADRTARLWDSATGHLVLTLEGHNGWVRTGVFSSDGQRLLTSSADGTARLWDRNTGKLLNTLEGHGGAVVSAVFSPNGENILTASLDSTARVWNTTSGQLLAILHCGEVDRAVFSPDGQRILTTAKEADRLWSLVSPERPFTLEGHTAGVIRAVFTLDGERILTVSSDQTSRLWNASTGRSLTTRQCVIYFDAVFSPNQEYMVTPYGHTAGIWNSGTGSQIALLRGHTGDIESAEFSKGNQWIVTASADHTARIWNVASGRLLVALKGHTDIVLRARFSPDGKRVLTASTDQTARVWDATSGNLLLSMNGHTGSITDAGFSRDGRRIVTVSGDHTGRIWNADNGRPLARLRGHTDIVVSVAFSPDGRRILTVGEDHTARLWNADDGHLLAVLEGHTDSITSAAFSPDSHLVVTASEDQTARVWNSDTGQVVAVLQGHTNEVLHAAFSPDGERILTASEDGTARMFRLVTLREITGLLVQ